MAGKNTFPSLSHALVEPLLDRSSFSSGHPLQWWSPDSCTPGGTSCFRRDERHTSSHRLVLSRYAADDKEYGAEQLPDLHVREGGGSSISRSFACCLLLIDERSVGAGGAIGAPCTSM